MVSKHASVEHNIANNDTLESTTIPRPSRLSAPATSPAAGSHFPSPGSPSTTPPRPSDADALPPISDPMEQVSFRETAATQEEDRPSPEPTYLSNIAVAGGTNHAFLFTDEQLRITDKKAPKKATKKPKATTSRAKKAGASAGPSHLAAARPGASVPQGTASKSPAEHIKSAPKGSKRKQPEDTGGESSHPQKLTIRIRARQGIETETRARME